MIDHHHVHSGKAHAAAVGGVLSMHEMRDEEMSVNVGACCNSATQLPGDRGGADDNFVFGAVNPGADDNDSIQPTAMWMWCGTCVSCLVIEA